MAVAIGLHRAIVWQAALLLFVLSAQALAETAHDEDNAGKIVSRLQAFDILRPCAGNACGATTGAAAETLSGYAKLANGDRVTFHDLPLQGSLLPLGADVGTGGTGGVSVVRHLMSLPIMAYEPEKKALAFVVPSGRPQAMIFKVNRAESGAFYVEPGTASLSPAIERMIERIAAKGLPGRSAQQEAAAERARIRSKRKPLMTDVNSVPPLEELGRAVVCNDRPYVSRSPSEVEGSVERVDGTLLEMQGGQTFDLAGVSGILIIATAEKSGAQGKQVAIALPYKVSEVLGALEKGSEIRLYWEGSRAYLYLRRESVAYRSFGQPHPPDFDSFIALTDDPKSGKRVAASIMGEVVRIAGKNVTVKVNDKRTPTYTITLTKDASIELFDQGDRQSTRPGGIDDVQVGSHISYFRGFGAVPDRIHVRIPESGAPSRKPK